MSHLSIWAMGVAGFAIAGSLASTQWFSQRAGIRPPPAAASAEVSVPGPRQPVTLAVAADYRGHYIVHPSVENYRIKMMVDTGASIVALTAADARALGIKSDDSSRNKVMLNTANGAVTGFRTVLREIRLGDIVVRNVDAVVLPERALSMSLLGNSFLGKLQGYEVQTGRMVLRG